MKNPGSATENLGPNPTFATDLCEPGNIGEKFFILISSSIRLKLKYIPHRVVMRIKWDHVSDSASPIAGIQINMSDSFYYRHQDEWSWQVQKSGKNLWEGWRKEKEHASVRQLLSFGPTFPMKGGSVSLEYNSWCTAPLQYLPGKSHG